MPRVFISYRRDDSRHATDRIHEALTVRYGQGNVFRDVEGIPAGTDFPRALEEEVDRCDVFLAVIGDHWLDRDEPGATRLDDPADFVRIETERALSRGALVVPVLVGARGMPQPHELPETLRPLAFLQAVPLRSGPDFKGDMARLADAIERGTGRPSERRRGGGRPPKRRRVAGPVPGSVVPHFRDREEELRSLRERLADEEPRLILVCGRGGMGKTALVTKLVHEIRDAGALESGEDAEHGYRVAYAQLRQPAWRSPDKIVELVCQVLGEPDSGRLRAKWRQDASLDEKLQFLFDEILRDRRCVIVLDNLEVALDGEGAFREEYDDLRKLVEACIEYDHDARIVGTTRRMVVLAPELEGRSASRKIEVPLDEGLPREEAIRVLRELDRDGGELIRDADEATLADVVERCHRIPHTLERLVGWLRARKTWKLPRLLEDPEAFARITENPARELYEMLGENERLVMQALAVYGEPVGGSAVGHLLPELPVDDLLEELVASYAARFDKDRFSLHPLDEAYAYGRIPDEGERGRRRLHERAAEYFRGRRKPEAEWKGIDDIEPVLAEFHQLVRAERHDEACRLLDSICLEYLHPWGLRGEHARMRALVMDRVTEDGLGEGNIGYTGSILIGAGELAKAHELLVQAAGLARGRGDRDAEAQWLRLLGVACSAMGDMRQSAEFHQRALAIDRETGNREQELKDVNNIGFVYVELGETGPGIEYSKRALCLAREIGSRRKGGSPLSNLGYAYAQLGRLPEAIQCYEKALEIAREGQFQLSESNRLRRLGLAYVALGESSRATECLERALALARRMGYRKRESECLRDLGRAACQIGDFERAQSFFEKGHVIAQAISARIPISECRLGLGQVRHHQQEVAAASDLYEHALAAEVHTTVHKCAVMLGILYIERGEKARAADYLTRGEAICRELLGKTPGLYEPTYTLALARLASAGADEARAAEALGTYRDALAITSAKGVVRSALQDLELLERARPSAPGLREARETLERALSGGDEE